jgi:type II secretory pathway predicted ATPase ExeA
MSVVLACHPKLKNDLHRPTMEEIGYRATVFTFDGITGSQREYIKWLIKECVLETTEISDILESNSYHYLQ